MPPKKSASSNQTSSRKAVSKKSAPKKKAASKAAPKKTGFKKASARRSSRKTKKHNVKKPVLISLLVCAVVIGAGLIFFLTNLNTVVKFAIEKYGSEATQTSVRVGSVKISLKEGSGSIRRLTVANPRGFKTKQAFSLGETGIKIDISSVTEEVKIIDDIRVIAPEIFVEINKDNQNNLQEIQKNLPSGGSGQTKARTENKKGEEPRLAIRRILFQEGKINARVAPLNKDYMLRMPSFEMRNLTGTPTEISEQIIGRITAKALAEVKRRGMDRASERIRKEAEKQGMEKLKGLF